MTESYQDALVRIAQNDYMIDNHYLDDGHRLIGAAYYINALERKLMELAGDPRLRLSRDMLEELFNALAYRTDLVYEPPVSETTLKVLREAAGMTRMRDGVTEYEPTQWLEDMGVETKADRVRRAVESLLDIQRELDRGNEDVDDWDLEDAWMRVEAGLADTDL